MSCLKNELITQYSSITTRASQNVVTNFRESGDPACGVAHLNRALASTRHQVCHHAAPVPRMPPLALPWPGCLANHIARHILSQLEACWRRPARCQQLAQVTVAAAAAETREQRSLDITGLQFRV